MTSKTLSEDYEEYNRRHPGDSIRMLAEIASHSLIISVLYPGSYIDVSPSLVFPDVTYVDSDRRASAFFSDAAAVLSLINTRKSYREPSSVTFLHTDYTRALPLPDGKFDLLVSLYAGFVSEACTRYLRPGGYLLANDSHADASMASLNPEYRLAAAIEKELDSYSVKTDELEEYLVPKQNRVVTVEMLQSTGRGPRYTRTPGAYLFQRQG